MKVLLINGSPNANGCTARALSEVARSLENEGMETETVHIGRDPIRGCTSCRACIRGLGRCVFDDDCVNAIREKANAADGLIVGSPVYYAAPNGSLMAFLDRFFYSGFGSSALRFKPAAAVVSARRAGTTAALDVLNKYFLISGMPIVPSQYWNMVHGNKPEEVEQDLEGLQTMRTLGRTMSWMLHCFEAGAKTGIETPQPEEKPERTNFIR